MKTLLLAFLLAFALPAYAKDKDKPWKADKEVYSVPDAGSSALLLGLSLGVIMILRRRSLA